MSHALRTPVAVLGILALVAPLDVRADEAWNDAGSVADTVVVRRPAATYADSSAVPEEDPLSAYLDTLSSGADDDFSLEALSISDAEVDSLIRVWEATGTTPALTAPRRRGPVDWRLSGVRYNRVEGLNVMPRVRIVAPGSVPAEAFGRVGWGLASEKWTWRAGGRVAASGAGLVPSVSYTYARDVYSYGAGGTPGNSLTALMLGRDYHDYYFGDGWTADASLASPRIGLRVGFRSEIQSSLPLETDFSLFERPAEFRPNPGIDRGRDRSLQGALTCGNDATAWSAGVTGRWAAEELGGEFAYESVQGDVAFRRSLAWGDVVSLQLSGGVISGDPPVQALHFLGGFQALRGYDVNEFATRRFAHARWDYRIGTDLFGSVPFLRHARLQLAPFMDSAMIFESQDRDGTIVRENDPDARFSAGIGVQRNLLGIPGGGGQLRLDVARRLDRSDEAWTFRLGITSP